MKWTPSSEQLSTQFKLRPVDYKCSWTLDKRLLDLATQFTKKPEPVTLHNLLINEV